jgi:predicted ABC-type ATPase
MLEGGPVTTSAPTATTNNPEWWNEHRNRPTQARAAVHKELKAKLRSDYPGVLSEKRVIVLAGPAGAGKTRLLDKQMPTEEQARFLRLDNDEAKKVLAQQAVRDGTYGRAIKPPAVRALEAQGEKFFPLELAPLFHNEASYLIGQLRSEAIRSGQNIIVDTVLSGQEAALALGEELRQAGYSVTVYDVELSQELSLESARERHAGAYEKALVSTDADAQFEPRSVPNDFIRSVYATEDGLAGHFREHCRPVRAKDAKA